ncbi:expressed unknown protein [Seminavis robusta]|uniref:Uncharacterized protein n=1 Tax=Seminavis robusta TaxID=568900 RepID=A0A9N8DPQ8_9STRA|nr:expressed unknown protein [Seminavis robusta]|eukprot:Sro268_g103730.1 n/a (578) ;mRNA; f:55843-57676
MERVANHDGRSSLVGSNNSSRQHPRSSRGSSSSIACAGTEASSRRYGHRGVVTNRSVLSSQEEGRSGPYPSEIQISRRAQHNQQERYFHESSESDRSVGSTMAIRSSYSTSLSTVSSLTQDKNTISYRYDREYRVEDEPYRRHLEPSEFDFRPSDDSRRGARVFKFRAEDLGFDTRFIRGEMPPSSRSYDGEYRSRPSHSRRGYSALEDRHHSMNRGRTRSYNDDERHGYYDDRSYTREDRHGYCDSNVSRASEPPRYRYPSRPISAPLWLVDEILEPTSRHSHRSQLPLPHQSTHSSRSANTGAPAEDMYRTARSAMPEPWDELERSVLGPQLRFESDLPCLQQVSRQLPNQSRPGAHHMAGPPPEYNQYGDFDDNESYPPKWEKLPAPGHHVTDVQAFPGSGFAKMGCSRSSSSSTKGSYLNTKPPAARAATPPPANQSQQVSKETQKAFPKGQYTVCPSSSEAQADTKAVMVEITPGVKERLRRADETREAVANDFFTPVSCRSCSKYLFCTADLKYFACPKCECISSLENDDRFEGRPIERHGLGVGFTVDTLFRMQQELSVEDPSSCDEQSK